MAVAVFGSVCVNTASSILQSQFSQGMRLIRLTTPLGPDTLLAECVRGEEGLDSGFNFAISALSTNAAINLKSLIGQPALLQLLTAHSGKDLRPFHGHITALCRFERNWTASAVNGRPQRRGWLHGILRQIL